MAASLLGCLPLGLVPLDQAPVSDIFQSALGCSVLGCPSTQLRWPLYVLILILTDARLRRSAAQALGLPTSRAWTRPLWCSTLTLSRPCPSVLSGDHLLWRPTTRRSAASGTRRLQVSPAVLCARSLPALDRSGLRPLRSSAAQPLWFSGIGLRPVRRSVVLALGSDLPSARVLRRSGALVFGRFGPHLLGCSS